MSDAVVVSLISAMGTILVAVVGGIFGIVHSRRQKRRDLNMSQKIETVRGQVQNSHQTNLRDDVDVVKEIVEKVDTAISELSSGLRSVAADVRGTRRDIGRLDNRDIERGKDIRRLEGKLEEHMDWSRGWSAQQEHADKTLDDRLGNLENTIDPRTE